MKQIINKLFEQIMGDSDLSKFYNGVNIAATKNKYAYYFAV